MPTPMRLFTLPAGLALASLALLGVARSDDVSPWQQNTIDPAWAQVAALRTKLMHRDPGQSDTANGAALLRAFTQLRPGDRLEIGPGRYVIPSKVTLDLAGTAEAPIWIVGSNPDDPPVITRPDAGQNLLNIGERRPCRYLALQHLHLTGGSVVIRFYDCAQVWLDRCELSHGQHGGLTVNSRNTDHMYITRNHLHHFLGGTGEAMYLGANHGQVIMRDSVIADNHVHDCGGEQGDGIELKQGSWNNWIVGNLIHDTHYPCLIAYGTGGHGLNVIERNICFRSGDNTMQVQGEAIVRNNLIMAAAGAGFASTDHQGRTRALQVIHNTIITTGRGANLSSWNGREQMVFANNAVYTQRGPAVRFPNGAAGVRLIGNVVVGAVEGAGQGFQSGRGLQDFQSVSWNGDRRDATPTPGSPLIGGADNTLVPQRDLHNVYRAPPPTTGAVAPR